MRLADALIIIGFGVLAAILAALVLLGLYWFVRDRSQPEHPILRNYPVLGKMRYFLEKLGPELRQYLFAGETEGKPFSRYDYEHVVKSAKYGRDVLGFGSLRDFEAEGYYLRNAMFPIQMEELRIDRSAKIHTKKYQLLLDGLFSRKERWMQDDAQAFLLADEDAVVIGPNTRHPFRVKGLIGMSAMSYGALGERAITALSEGLGLAQGTWMNTGEGGLSPYHLKGGVDIIMQIGPGLFGVRDDEGNFNWEELKRKSEIPQVKAFELKLAQGAKTRGGHVDGEKVTPEIAAIRKVKPYQSIDSPNRFHEFHDVPTMIDFMERMRACTGKPIGMKMVAGGSDAAEELAAYMKETGKGPDFITVDGGEGGTGATFQELADSVGLPIKSALMIVDATLRKYGVRDRVKLIASGKLFTPDRIAVALGMGADLVNIARGFMITVGCIQALKCHSNACPVGVATTDPHLQRALVIDEKKYRVANYLLTLREGLFRVAASAGLASPVEIGREHVMFKDRRGTVQSLESIYRRMFREVDAPRARRISDHSERGGIGRDRSGSGTARSSGGGGADPAGGTRGGSGIRRSGSGGIVPGIAGLSDSVLAPFAGSVSADGSFESGEGLPLDPDHVSGMSGIPEMPEVSGKTGMSEMPVTADTDEPETPQTL